MNKEEILNRSRKENQKGDEREKEITTKVNEIGFLSISGVTALMAVEFLFHGTLINPSLYLLIAAASSIYQYAVNYYYKREAAYLIMTAFFGVIAIALLLHVIGITF